MTSCKPFPRWTVVGMLPHGTAALYAPSHSRNAMVATLIEAVTAGKPFLGYVTLKSPVLVLDDPEGFYDEADLIGIMQDSGVKLLVLPMASFKANKTTKKPNSHSDYFALNRVAHRFKATILTLPDIRSDAIDFAVDTIISFTIPATADDAVPYRFKVEARDVKPIRGQAAFNPASGYLEAV